ncbi:MAG: hypothetical protein ACRYFS_04420 [Janthinobacterium lividum]
MKQTLMALTVWIMLCVSLSAAPPHYRLTDVGPDSDQNQNLVINDRGQVAGSYPSGLLVNAGDHGLRGFLWMHGRQTNLRIRTSYDSTIVTAINNFGQITGNLDGTFDGAILVIVSHAFLWEHGTLNDLGAPEGDVVSEARAINDKGEIVGRAYGTGRPVDDDLRLTEHHAFLYRDGRMIDLGAGEADAINNQGQIVGETPGTVLLEAALWENGVAKKLGVPGIAVAINNKGQILIDSGQGPMLWQKGRMSLLPLPPGSGQARAIGINDRGQIVGTADLAESPRAMLWQGRKVFNLNSVISPRSGWILTSASAINNKGQIVGHGLFRGREHAFLLTPTI